MSLLTAEHIDYYYKDGGMQRYILKDVDYTFEKGKFYVILGPSGSGKTTFLSLISGLDVPNKGRILYDGQDIQTIGLNNFRRNKIGIVFQFYNLIPYLTGAENILVAMKTSGSKESKTEQVSIALNLLDYMGIDTQKANRLVNKLSGGEQQRVAIARALSTNAELIIADEPTGNIDFETEADIVQIFKELATKHNKCVVVVTHSQEVARQADEVILLQRAGLHEQEEVLDNTEKKDDII